MTSYQLNVQFGSAYAKFNTCFFPLVERCGERVTLDIFGVSTDFTTKEATELREFICDQCKTQKTHISNLTTGYSIDKNDKKICFDCCGKNDHEALKSLPIGGRYTLYLTKDDTGVWSVSNWPGTAKYLIMTWNNNRPLKGRHNVTGTRYDVWFKVDGNLFHGVQYGEMTQVCHVRRIKNR